MLAIALGIAFGAATLFGVSFALGAFFAGMVLSESELSHRAAEETLPLRDAFAVLFFVSVGMLFDPATLLDQVWPLLGALAIVVFGKSIAAYLIVRAFGHPTGGRRWSSRPAWRRSASSPSSWPVSASRSACCLEQAQDLILAAAILSILINPTAFVLLDRFRARRAIGAGGSETGKQAREIRADRRSPTISSWSAMAGSAR